MDVFWGRKFTSENKKTKRLYLLVDESAASDCTLFRAFISVFDLYYTYDVDLKQMGNIHERLTLWLLWCRTVDDHPVSYR